MMLRQAARLREPRAAHIADASMSPEVHGKAARPRESFAAHTADMRLLSGVGPLMRGQVALF